MRIAWTVGTLAPTMQWGLGNLISCALFRALPKWRGLRGVFSSELNYKLISQNRRANAHARPLVNYIDIAERANSSDASTRIYIAERADSSDGNR